MSRHVPPGWRARAAAALCAAAAAAPAATIGYWRFEGAGAAWRADATTNGLDLSTAGAAPAPVAPSAGAGAAFPNPVPASGLANTQAVDFGTAQAGHLAVADAPALSPAAGLTVEAFAHRRARTPGTQYVASQWRYASGSERSWGLGVAGTSPPAGLVADELFFVASVDGEASDAIGSGLLVSTGRDVYVSAGWDGTPAGALTFRALELPGATGRVAAVAGPGGALHDSAGALNVGAYNDGSSRWTGLLDEVRLSAGARPESELLPGTGVVWAAQVFPPSIAPPGGLFSGAVTVGVSCATAGATIRFTTDGSDPDAGDPLYSGPFILTNDATVVARAWREGGLPSEATTAMFRKIGLPFLGRVRARPASRISASNWSVGAETMDRGYTVYANWRAHLGPLGAKRARIQAGWARTEPAPGVYDWAWLDEIVPDMAAQGVRPWVDLCYGNPAYAGGGTAAVSSPLPSSPEALAAWDAFVRAFVRRYGAHVDEWEVWNEPNIQSIAATEYAAFLIRTATVLREEQPAARIVGMVLSGTGTAYPTAVLGAMQAQGKLGLIDYVCYHPYAYNPDSVYGAVAALRAAVEAFDPRIRLWQGENGAPSVRGAYGALKDYDWTETSQAKWALRRLLGDLGRGIPSSLFSIADMKYGSNWNRKGLIAMDDALAVGHRKEAYAAVQNLTALFDDRLELVPSFAAAHTSARPLAVFGYRRKDTGEHLVAFWHSDQTPGDLRDPADTVDFTFADARFARPVWVDLLTGVVREVPAHRWTVAGGTNHVFTGIPVYDSPCLLASGAAVLTASQLWTADRFDEGERQDDAVSGDAADPDGDGEPNLADWAADAPPPPIAGVAGTGGVRIVTLALPGAAAAAATRAYRLRLDR